MTNDPAAHLPSAVLLFPAGKPAPANAAEAFGPIAEPIGPALADLPNGEQRLLKLNNLTVEVGFWDTNMENRQLFADLAISPLKQTLDPIVREGRAFASISVLEGDATNALMLVSQFVGTLFEETGAEAVWLPEQGLVNSKVMFMHDLYEDQMERTWFRVHAMRAGGDSPESVAFTRGLRVLGAHELQFRGVSEPAALFEQLTAATAALLKDGRVPAPGTELAVGGAAYRAVPGEDLVGEGVPVLELEPAATAPPVEKSRRKGWFGKR